MYQTLMEFLQFLGISNTAPETLGEFLQWFVLVVVCVCIIRFVLNSFYAVVYWVRRGDR